MNKFDFKTTKIINSRNYTVRVYKLKSTHALFAYFGIITNTVHDDLLICKF